MKKHLELQANHVISTLPDSLIDRRRILQALRKCLVKGSVARTRVNEMLHFLDEHEKLQRELPLISPRGGNGE